MTGGANPEAVKVVVRCRPLNSKEKADGRAQIVDMDTKSGQVSLRNPAADSSEAPKTFTFDAAYDANCTQEQIYEQSAKPIVNSCMQGYNGTLLDRGLRGSVQQGTIFAYGQTGTGKSHTMTGQPGEQAGIIPRSFAHIFEGVEGSSDTQWMVRASFLEIYNEEVRA
eukprot:1157921-Pelagomonas_calceolata.AAC.5